MLIKVTVLIANDDYTNNSLGIIVKGALEEIPALINPEEIIYAVPSKVPGVTTMVKFKVGATLDLKESIDELVELANQFQEVGISEAEAAKFGISLDA